ncbi:MAG: hypothetical protein ABH879_02295 [archaeon]
MLAAQRILVSRFKGREAEGFAGFHRAHVENGSGFRRPESESKAEEPVRARAAPAVSRSLERIVVDTISSGSNPLEASAVNIYYGEKKDTQSDSAPTDQVGASGQSAFAPDDAVPSITIYPNLLHYSSYHEAAFNAYQTAAYVHSPVSEDMRAPVYWKQAELAVPHMYAGAAYDSESYSSQANSYEPSTDMGYRTEKAANIPYQVSRTIPSIELPVLEIFQPKVDEDQRQYQKRDDKQIGDNGRRYQEQIHWDFSVEQPDYREQQEPYHERLSEYAGDHTEVLPEDFLTKINETRHYGSDQHEQDQETEDISAVLTDHTNVRPVLNLQDTASTEFRQTAHQHPTQNPDDLSFEDIHVEYIADRPGPTDFVLEHDPAPQPGSPDAALHYAKSEEPKVDEDQRQYRRDERRERQYQKDGQRDDDHKRPENRQMDLSPGYRESRAEPAHADLKSSSAENADFFRGETLPAAEPSGEINLEYNDRSTESFTLDPGQESFRSRTYPDHLQTEVAGKISEPDHNHLTIHTEQKFAEEMAYGHAKQPLTLMLSEYRFASPDNWEFGMQSAPTIDTKPEVFTPQFTEETPLKYSQAEQPLDIRLSVSLRAKASSLVEAAYSPDTPPHVSDYQRADPDIPEMKLGHLRYGEDRASIESLDKDEASTLDQIMVSAFVPEVTVTIDYVPAPAETEDYQPVSRTQEQGSLQDYQKSDAANSTTLEEKLQDRMKSIRPKPGREYDSSETVPYSPQSTFEKNIADIAEVPMLMELDMPGQGSAQQEGYLPQSKELTQPEEYAKPVELTEQEVDSISQTEGISYAQPQLQVISWAEDWSIPTDESFELAHDQYASGSDPVEDAIKKDPEKERDQCTVKPELYSRATELKMRDEEEKADNCTVKPEVEDKDYCPVKPGVEEITEQVFDEKVALDVCDVKPELTERFYVDAGTEVRWFSLVKDGVSLSNDIVNEEEEYHIRVKEQDTDLDRPYYESKSATFVTKSNSGYAIIDALLRGMGLVPAWEINQQIDSDTELTEGELYLRDVMGVSHAVKSIAVDYIVVFRDKTTGTEELKDLAEVISMEDINTSRYTIDLIAQARSGSSRKEFKEHITGGYRAPELEKIVNDGTLREEPLLGRGGIDEFVPKAGDIYDIVIDAQGVHDRNDENIEGAYSAMKVYITEDDIKSDETQVMKVKDKEGNDKLYATRANRLSAIIARKLEEQGYKGMFIEIETHKEEGTAEYKNGGALNNTTIYLANIEGALEAFIEKEPYVQVYQINILIEQTRKNHSQALKRVA